MATIINPSKRRPLTKDTTTKAPTEMIATPPQRPSIPSMRLKALIMPTVHTTQIRRSMLQCTSNPRKFPIPLPLLKKRNAATTTCTPSLIQGERPQRSSASPSKTRRAEATANARYQFPFSAPDMLVSRITRSPIVMKVPQTAKPPACGTGVVWIRRSPGRSIKPNFGPNQIMTRVSDSAIVKAPAKVRSA